MDKIILSKQQVQELIQRNRYPVDEKTKFLSRCIDGRYPNKKNLPVLALPGGDLGELALILAAGNSFGFEVDGEKTLETLIETIGGEKNFGFHGGCGHWKQIQLDSKAYDLKISQIGFIKEKLTTNYFDLKDEHLEGAILMVKGNFGIYPRYFLETEEGKGEVEVFVYQQSLVDERHRALAKKLIENKAVKLFPGLDEEYLYQVLSEETENHLFETVKRIARGLPIYKVEFEEEGGFEIEEMGKIS